MSNVSNQKQKEIVNQLAVENPPIPVTVNTDFYDLPLRPETDASAGIDLRACIKKSATLTPGASRLFSAGIRIALPLGMEAQIRPRSGLAYKHAITVLNSPGTIDSDYRGDIGVILVNCSTTSYTVEPGDRIAQMVIAQEFTTSSTLQVVHSLDETERGEDGFGSTGVK